jgi:hypothetical protein
MGLIRAFSHQLSAGNRVGRFFFVLPTVDGLLIIVEDPPARNEAGKKACIYAFLSLK